MSMVTLEAFFDVVAWFVVTFMFLASLVPFSLFSFVPFLLSLFFFVSFFFCLFFVVFCVSFPPPSFLCCICVFVLMLV